MSTGVDTEKVYEVVAHREGRWWVFDVPELDAMGQAATLSKVAEEARGIIAAWDEDGPEFDAVRVRVRLDGEAEALRLWAEAEAEEQAARQALQHAADRRREAVTMLRTDKLYSAADVSQILGVSRQRVYQLSAK